MQYGIQSDPAFTRLQNIFYQENYIVKIQFGDTQEREREREKKQEIEKQISHLIL